MAVAGDVDKFEAWAGGGRRLMGVGLTGTLPAYAAGLVLYLERSFLSRSIP
jgi:hypothetical protein